MIFKPRKLRPKVKYLGNKARSTYKISLRFIRKQEARHEERKRQNAVSELRNNHHFVKKDITRKASHNQALSLLTVKLVYDGLTDHLKIIQMEVPKGARTLKISTISNRLENGGSASNADFKERQLLSKGVKKKMVVHLWPFLRDRSQNGRSLSRS